MNNDHVQSFQHEYLKKINSHPFLPADREYQDFREAQLYNSSDKREICF